MALRASGRSITTTATRSSRETCTGTRIQPTIADHREVISMPISALDHIVLNVADVERSLEFYQGCLGLSAERVEEWRQGILSFPSVRINATTIIDLVRRTAESPRDNGGFNLNHFCLVTDDAELTGIS